ncbi:MAG: hypothetical protein IPN91_14285 [Holophagaceae bacterium]|uniref:Uncharacterized protein n=1 Tax=Candidatus Geothrix odensensis TaxID=2954440 RepID=A0A936F4N0_9BACT|nr:hypothetical protein [Candidatus Geothrix odensensis]
MEVKPPSSRWALLRASQGQALLLFTSRKMLAAFRPRLEAALRGSPSSCRTVSRARSCWTASAPPSAALGLARFWQGVDQVGVR